jgi:hypothetical protein
LSANPEGDSTVEAAVRHALRTTLRRDLLVS